MKNFGFMFLLVVCLGSMGASSVFAGHPLKENKLIFGETPEWAEQKKFKKKTTHIYFASHNFYYNIEANNYVVMHQGKWQIQDSWPKEIKIVYLKVSKQIEMRMSDREIPLYNKEHQKKYGVGNIGR